MVLKKTHYELLKQNCIHVVQKEVLLFKLNIADIIVILLVLLPCKIVICGYD